MKKIVLEMLMLAALAGCGGAGGAAAGAPCQSSSDCASDLACCCPTVNGTQFAADGSCANVQVCTALQNGSCP